MGGNLVGQGVPNCELFGGRSVFKESGSSLILVTTECGSLSDSLEEEGRHNRNLLYTSGLE